MCIQITPNLPSKCISYAKRRKQMFGCRPWEYSTPANDIITIQRPKFHLAHTVWVRRTVRTYFRRFGTTRSMNWFGLLVVSLSLWHRGWMSCPSFSLFPSPSLSLSLCIFVCVCLWTYVAQVSSAFAALSPTGAHRRYCRGDDGHAGEYGNGRRARQPESQ